MPLPFSSWPAPNRRIDYEGADASHVQGVVKARHDQMVALVETMRMTADGFAADSFRVAARGPESPGQSR